MFQHAQHITRLLGAPLCAALLLTAGCADEKTSAPPAAESQQTQTKAAAADDTAAKDKEVKVNVYYPKNDGMGLVADSRTVKLGGEDKYTDGEGADECLPETREAAQRQGSGRCRYGGFLQGAAEEFQRRVDGGRDARRINRQHAHGFPRGEKGAHPH